MITPAYAQTMAAYNAEMNRRLYTAAARIDDARRREPLGAFWGSLHGTLNHLLWADRMWMARFANWPRPETRQRDSAALIELFDNLHAARIADDAAISAWAATLTPDWLAGDLTWFSGGSGREMTCRRDILIVHLFNHQTHHRGQAHCLITQLGERTGDTDLPWVL